MVRFEKGTNDFLEREIGKEGVAALKAHIESIRKNQAVSRRTAPLKLAILEEMFDKNAFAENEGVYFLPDRQMRKYRQELRRRGPRRRIAKRPAPQVRPSKVFISKKPIKNPVVRLLASLPVKVKEWNKIPKIRRGQLAKLLKKEIPKRFSVAKIPENLISEFVLRLTVHDPELTRNLGESFFRNVYNRFKLLREDMRKYPERTLSFVLDTAEIETWEGFPRREKVSEVPVSFKLLHSELKGAKNAKSYWDKLSKKKKESVTRTILSHARKFGMKLDFKGLSFPSDSLIGLRLKRNPREGEKVYQNAFVEAFFNILWNRRGLELTTHNLNDIIQSTQKEACKKFISWMQDKEKAMLTAQGEVKREKVIV